MKITERDITMTHYGEDYFLSIPCSIYKYQELKEFILEAVKQFDLTKVDFKE